MISSVLQTASRPFVVFDPASKMHRTHYAKFLETYSWAHCPVRFIVDEDQDNLVAMVQHKLAAYYLQKEFGKFKVAEAA